MHQRFNKRIEHVGVEFHLGVRDNDIDFLVLFFTRNADGSFEPGRE